MRAVVVLGLLTQVAYAERVVVDDAADTMTVVGYRNGKPMPLTVIEVDGVLVEVKTARAYIAMRDAAAAAGVYLSPWSGFRDNERQAELYADWKAGYGVRAAKPGYSNHQSGLAIDIGVYDESDDTYLWLAQNGGHFGFRRTVPDEPWHWEYSPPRKVAPKKRAPASVRRAR